MPLFSSNHKETWHRKLANSGAYQCLVGDPSAGGFPFDALRHATDEYVSTKKLAAGTQICDLRLGEIIADHVDKKGGAREIALLACIHLVTPAMSAEILVCFREECRLAGSNARYLQCLTLTHYAYPNLVEAQECRIAEALIQTIITKDLFKSVKELIDIIGSATNPYFLPATYINHLLGLTHFDTFFQSHVQALEEQRKFMSLYNEVSWLRAVTALPPAALALTVMEAQIPSWRRWTNWKPNYLLLMKWEGRNFTDEQRTSLTPIFDLEGPDTTGNGRETLRNSVPGCFDNIRILNQDTAVLNCLLKTLDLAQSIPGSTGIDLFIFLCLDNPNPVDDELLSLTEGILSTADESCIDGMLFWLKSQALGATFNDQMVALTKALPVFDVHPQLHQLVGGDWATMVTEVMHIAQLEYCIQLETGVADNFGMKIHAFGRAILKAKWIRPSLGADFIQKMQNFPSEETLKKIFKHVQTSNTSIEIVRKYLAATLGGKDDNRDSLLSQIESQINWGSGMDGDRMHVYNTVRNLRYLDPTVVSACQSQILAEDSFLLKDLLPIIRHDTTSACANLARLLSRRRQLRLTVHTCWTELLFSLMKHQSRQLLTWAAETLPVTHWFTFVADLTVLFPGNESRLYKSGLGITTLRCGWWDLLSRQYLDAIKRLEAIFSGQANLKWLYFQEVSNIAVLLDLLQGRTPASSLHRKILNYIKPSQQVIAQVCEALATFSGTSAVGRQAFESVLRRHQSRWPRSASETLLVAWGQSRGIQHSDVTALNALAELLELSIVMDQSGFTTARDIFVSDFTRILDLATALEAIRVTLRFHDEPRTSSFLRGLRVEDARGCADPAIPEGLVDAIESLGDGCYELCFSLTQLKAHEKKAVGINDSNRFRMLIVRVSLLRNAGFCIHFYPAEDSTKTHSHKLSYSSGAAPTGTICTTKPTLFTYRLGRAIHSFLSNGNRDLKSLHKLVLSTLESRAADCLVCGSSLGSKVWRPTTCGDSCTTALSLSPPEVNASHLLCDGPVLDFLLTCVYSAAADATGLDLLPGCPVPKASLKVVIDSFPSLPKDVSATNLLASIRGNDTHAANRLRLLVWLGISFRGFMLSVPDSARVPSMPNVHQFIMLNSAPDREQQFQGYVESYTAAVRGGAAAGSSSSTSRAGGVTFHGTPATRLWKVLTEGLKNMSNTPFMAHGASHGQGIYLADEPAMSLGYSGSTGAVTWRNSVWANHQVLLGCELAGHTANSYHVVPEEGRVLIRYVFLCPAGFRAPQARLIDGAMKSTYSALQTGVLA